MACCGKTFRVSKTVKEAVPVVAVSNLIKMHYIGLYTLNWYIAETGAKYEFGMLRMYGYVDGKDVASLLAVIEDGKPAFEAIV